MNTLIHSVFDLFSQNFLTDTIDLTPSAKRRITPEMLMHWVRDYAHGHTKFILNIMAVHCVNTRLSTVGKSESNYIYALLNGLDHPEDVRVDFATYGPRGNVETFYTFKMKNKNECLYFVAHYFEDEELEGELTLLISESWTIMINQLALYAKGLQHPELRKKVGIFVSHVKEDYLRRKAALKKLIYNENPQDIFPEGGI